MTKRFTGEFDKQYSGVHYNGEQLTNFEVVDLLNNLSEDNEYLEKRFKEEEWHYDHIDEDRDAWRHKCQELEKENEQLKLELDTHKHPLWSTREAERIVNELKQEIEELKEEIKDLNDVLARYEEKELEND